MNIGFDKLPLSIFLSSTIAWLVDVAGTNSIKNENEIEIERVLV